jgi:sulfite exporter TauE/SafE
MAGLAATPHCLGMCGGFPLHLAKAGGRGNVVFRQMLFVLGKAFTYMFLGTLAAAFGAIYLKTRHYLPWLQVCVCSQVL